MMCVYPSVVVIRECPAASFMAAMFSPIFAPILMKECRRSCIRMCGSFAYSNAHSNGLRMLFIGRRVLPNAREYIFAAQCLGFIQRSLQIRYNRIA